MLNFIILLEKQLKKQALLLISFAFNKAILTKQPDAKIVIPPPSVAVISWKANTQRDDHIRLLQDEGDMVWQKKTIMVCAAI